MKIFLCLLMLLFSANAFSVTSGWLGLGSTTRNYGTAQKEASGDTTKFSLNPTLIVGVTLPFFFANTFFIPSIGYSRFKTEDNTTRSELILQYHLKQEMLPAFSFIYGLSNTITMIGGDGGVVSLNNGNSTANFYTPSKSKSSYLASVDLGAEYIFTNTWGARFKISIDRFLSSERRRLSHQLTMNYYF
jgi:hypothetical protein